jgi:O-antigen/teichoic acid export membrane protein
MSRTNRFVGGLSLSYLSQLAVMIAGLWVTPNLLHRLGQHEYGLWLVAMQIVAYLALLDFGVIALLPRELAYITGSNAGADLAGELRKALAQTLRMSLWQMPAVCLLVFCFWWAIPAEWASLRKPVGFIFIAFAILVPARIFQAALLGMQDLAFAAKSQGAATLCMTLGAAGFVYAGFGLDALPICWAFSQVVLLTVSYFRLRRHFPEILAALISPVGKMNYGGRLQRGLWVTTSQIAQILLNGTDLFVIGKIMGPGAVVVYAFSGKLITVLANQPLALMQAAGPALSEMKTSESVARQTQACSALNQATLLCSGVIACIILLCNRGFISWWVGAKQFGGLGLTELLLAVMILRHWNNPLVYALFCFGNERRVALTAILDGVVTVSMMIFLVYRFGVKGAPLGSIAGVCLVSLPANLMALAVGRGESLRSLLIPLTPWFWRFGIMLAISGAAGVFLELSNPVLIGLAAVSITAIYALVMLRPALRDPLGIYLRPKWANLRERIAVLPVIQRASN